MILLLEDSLAINIYQFYLKKDLKFITSAESCTVGCDIFEVCFIVQKVMLCF